MSFVLTPLTSHEGELYRNGCSHSAWREIVDRLCAVIIAAETSSKDTHRLDHADELGVLDAAHGSMKAARVWVIIGEPDATLREAIDAMQEEE